MDTSFRTLYIENIPLNINEKILVKLFSQFGPVKGVEMPAFDQEHPLCRGLPKPLAKGYAFVEFASRAGADKACRLFNNLSFIRNATTKQLHNQTAAMISCLSGGDVDCDKSDATKDDDHDLAMAILENLEFRRLLLLRVMPKKTYHELTSKYNDTRLQSLVGAAKLLVCTNLN